MNTVLESRLADLILMQIEFSADDLTDNGDVTLDPAHEANARNNGIGSLFNQHSRAGHIVWTGGVERSQAPHRKGGMIRVWEGTAVGRQWAESLRDA